MSKDFWRAQLVSSSRPLTLEDCERGYKNLSALEDQRRVDGPWHLLRGRDWCDACGFRSLGMWTHGDPRDEAK